MTFSLFSLSTLIIPTCLVVLTGLIWVCNIYITAFGKKSTNYAK